MEKKPSLLGVNKPILIVDSTKLIDDLKSLEFSIVANVHHERLK